MPSLLSCFHPFSLSSFLVLRPLLASRAFMCSSVLVLLMSHSHNFCCRYCYRVFIIYMSPHFSCSYSFWLSCARAFIICIHPAFFVSSFSCLTCFRIFIISLSLPSSFSSCYCLSCFQVVLCSRSPHCSVFSFS